MILDQMPEMDMPVGVGQGGGDEDATVGHGAIVREVVGGRKSASRERQRPESGAPTSDPKTDLAFFAWPRQDAALLKTRSRGFRFASARLRLQLKVAAGLPDPAATGDHRSPIHVGNRRPKVSPPWLGQETGHNV